MKAATISEFDAFAPFRYLDGLGRLLTWRASRKATVALAAILAILLPLLLVAASQWIAWTSVTSERLSQLRFAAHEVVGRMDQSIDRADNLLTSIAERPHDICSNAHIRSLQELVFQNPEVRNIRYQSDDGISCGAVGSANSMPPAFTRDWHTPAGMNLWFDQPSAFNPNIRALIVGYLGHGVSIDTGAFLGARPELGRIAMVLFDTVSNRAFGVINDPVVDHLRTYIDGPNSVETLEFLVVRVASDRYPFVAVAHEPIEGLRAAWRRQAIFFTPIGGTVGLVISALVIALARRRLSLRGELELAMQNRELICYFQPIVDLKSGQCIAAEALVRWRRQDGSLVRPDLFIPLAEDTGLIRPITEQVVAYLVREAGDLLRRDGEFYISVNFAASDLATDWPLQVIANALKNTGISPRQIAVEVTERGLVDAEATRGTIQALRQAGHRVLIDDFGTGHSNIAYLNMFAVDGIKIDKLFIDTIGTETASSGVAGHIVKMAQELGLKVIAEGVEDKNQAQELAKLDVQYAQGFLFSKPLPLEEFRRTFRTARQAA